MSTAKEKLQEFKKNMSKYNPMIAWDDIKVGGVYHIPPIKTLCRRDIIILEKDTDGAKYKRIDDTEQKVGNIAKTSVYAKIMIVKKVY